MTKLLSFGASKHTLSYMISFPACSDITVFFLNTNLISILLGIVGEWIIRGRDDSQKAGV